MAWTRDRLAGPAHATGIGHRARYAACRPPRRAARRVAPFPGGRGRLLCAPSTAAWVPCRRPCRRGGCRPRAARNARRSPFPTPPRRPRWRRAAGRCRPAPRPQHKGGDGQQVRDVWDVHAFAELAGVDLEGERSRVGQPRPSGRVQGVGHGGKMRDGRAWAQPFRLRRPLPACCFLFLCCAGRGRAPQRRACPPCQAGRVFMQTARRPHMLSRFFGADMQPARQQNRAAVCALCRLRLRPRFREFVLNRDALAHEQRRAVAPWLASKDAVAWKRA